MTYRLFLITIALASIAGCGTTRWSDTARTATEQLLVSDAVDRAVSHIDFRSLAGKQVFVDDNAVKGSLDFAYLVSTVRQQILASGGILKEKREESDYIVEIRAGAIGTDRHDLLFGVPALTVPTVPTLTGVPSQIPEIPLMKRTDQRGVAKVSLFVYNRQSGRIVWQSGVVPEESRARASWFFGAGPFQRGSIYSGTKFAGDRFHIPMIDLDRSREGVNGTVSVAEEAFFVEPKKESAVAQKPADGATAAAQPKPEAPKNGTAAAPGAPAPGGSQVIQAGLTVPSQTPAKPPDEAKPAPAEAKPSPPPAPATATEAKPAAPSATPDAKPAAAPPTAAPPTPPAVPPAGGKPEKPPEPSAGQWKIPDSIRPLPPTVGAAQAEKPSSPNSDWVPAMDPLPIIRR